MRIKLNRGPAKGKYFTVPDDTYKWRVQFPKKAVVEPIGPDGYFDPNGKFTFEVRTGEYHKSFTRLKNGAIVFEWMGWYDGEV